MSPDLGIGGRTGPGIVDFASDPEVIWSIFQRISGERAFDIGANGGMTSRLLAERFTEVHAFEPAAESYDHLSAGLPEHVWAHKVAVSDHDGEVTLDVREVLGKWGELTTGESMAQSWGEHTGRRSVPCVTVDAFAAEHGDPDFIKVDTEGHERAVIRGALETIGRCDPRLLIEVHDREQGEWIIGAIGRTLTQVRHPAYSPGSPYYENHWFLLRGV